MHNRELIAYFNAKLWSLHQIFCVCKNQDQRKPKEQEKVDEKTKLGRSFVATFNQLSQQNKRQVVEKLSRHSTIVAIKVEKSS